MLQKIPTNEKKIKVESQKVVGRSSSDMGLSSSWSRVKLDEGVAHVLVDLHDGSLVSASVAVVGSREDGHHVLLVSPVVSLHDQLMSSADQSQAVVAIEGLRDVLAKGVASSSRGDSPSSSLIGITPQQIAHGSVVGNLLDSVQASDRVQALDGGRQATVHAQDLLLDESRQGKVVKEVSEVLPDVGSSILAKALVIEPIHLGDLSTFVISSEDGEALLVSHLHGDQKCHRFHRVIPSVDVVSHEQIVGIRRLASDAEEFHQIVELAVNISAHGDGTIDCLNIGLLHQDFLSLLTEIFDLLFRQRLALSQDLDELVDVDVDHWVCGE